MEVNYTTYGKKKIMQALDNAIKACSWITEWNVKLSVEQIIRDAESKVYDAMKYTEEAQ